ncbi:MAG: glutathione S-transferase family protein [Hyphomicrobiales bacterium]|nr:glutathione S-transferase family protein [Hyphomicrobiales bacterium]
MLVDGHWTENWQPVQAKDVNGSFIRQTSSFRNWVTLDGAPGPTGEGGFKAAAGRYHLYVALICPWASRTLMVRALKKLDDAVSVTIMEPFLTDKGWRFGDFPGSSVDTLNGAEYLHEIYTKADPHFTGRATVPVLWDKQREIIVNNESADIVAMLNGAFDAWGDASFNLRPAGILSEIDALNTSLYDRLNNGVYKAGFATTQAAYEDAAIGVFDMLDELETRLSDGRRFLFPDALTESDIRLFVTLIRFDAAYHGLFKCNLRRLADYPRLTAYTARVLAIPGMAGTVNVDHIKRGYYSIKALNPNGVTPLGPINQFSTKRSLA